MPTFQPPTVVELPTLYTAPDRQHPVEEPVASLLFRYYAPRGPVGRTVLKRGGVYETVVTPTVDEVNDAEEAYLGGHVYEIDQATADALTAAGYGANIS